ncbi:tail fiber assembly protein [Gilliamella sp. ESL0441]|uniref:tail fiber assembly protein n=1 Tax=Gilliamella sp. ESL0441 TaxID=2704654 RepID=UPI001C69D281|nr:tail fiber assembly protein [Gilliamella sp. ESL0441]QYN44512.1 tail fiber assembly protein [Gilliamella sp. ESL0441]
MINYYFDNTNEFKPFTHELEANIDTLPPDNALRIPPEFKNGCWPCEQNGTWILVEDNRGKTVYNINTKESSTVDYLGKIKEGHTQLEPFEFCKWDGKKWILDEEEKRDFKIKKNVTIRDSLLNEANAEIEIINRAVKLHRASEEDKQRLNKLEIYTIDLYELDLNNIDVVFPDKP